MDKLIKFKMRLMVVGCAIVTSLCIFLTAVLIADYNMVAKLPKGICSTRNGTLIPNIDDTIEIINVLLTETSGETYTITLSYPPPSTDIIPVSEADIREWCKKVKNTVVDCHYNLKEKKGWTQSISNGWLGFWIVLTSVLFIGMLFLIKFAYRVEKYFKKKRNERALLSEVIYRDVMVLGV